MKPKFYTYLFVVVCVVLVACKSASKLYQQGRYDDAVAAAVKKLQKKPSDAATLDILQNAYRFAVEDHENKIRGYAASSDQLKAEYTYNEYLDLQRLYDAIRKAPSVADIVQPTDYSSYVATFQEEASNVRVERGDALMNNNNKQSSQAAYTEFRQALALKPGDLSVQQRMDQAYAEAVTNVVVNPIGPSGYQYSSSNYNYNFTSFDYDFLQYLKSNTSSQFVQYYSGSQFPGTNVRVDQVVDLRFSNMNIGRYRDQRTVREVSKQIVSKEIVFKPDSVVKEYTTVTAKITTTHRTLSSDGLLQATIRDGNNNFLWSDTYRGEYNWSVDFASFTGDERALSDDDKRIINQKDVLPPSNSQIIGIIIDEIRNSAECGVRDFYNGY